MIEVIFKDKEQGTLQGKWTTATIQPHNFAGQTVLTLELRGESGVGNASITLDQVVAWRDVPEPKSVPKLGAVK